jgi:hypothetical protein
MMFVQNPFRRETMTANRLYDTFFREVRQLWPDLHLPVVRNLAWCMCGMYLSRSVQLQHIAAYIPSGAKLVSVTRRLSRFFRGAAVRVRPRYTPLARAWLIASAESVGEIRLIMDSTQVSAHHQLVMVALAFRRRALPIAWTWVAHQRGFSSACHQRALLSYVRTLLPQRIPVLLVGDSEFGSIELLRQLERWHWSYVVQQKSKHLVKLSHQRKYRALRRLAEGPGQRSWWPKTRLTKQELRTTMLLEWAAGEKEPWYLATNLETPAAALQAYRRRMWIDELFGDLKRHGVDLEMTHLRHIERLSRLTLLVAVLYLWLLATGVRMIRRGVRHLVDRRERRDLSLFQIGWRIVARWLRGGDLAFPGSIHLLKMSGG